MPSETVARYDEDWGDSLLGDKSHCAIFDNSKIRGIVPDFAATIPFAEGRGKLSPGTTPTRRPSGSAPISTSKWIASSPLKLPFARPEHAARLGLAGRLSTGRSLDPAGLARVANHRRRGYAYGR